MDGLRSMTAAIRLEKYGRRLHASDEAFRILPILSTKRAAVSVSGRGTGSTSDAHVELFGPNASIPNAGLISILATLAASREIALTISSPVRSRQLSDFFAENSISSGASGVADELGEFCALHQGGIIATRSEEDKAAVVAGLLRLFPASNIAIVCESDLRRERFTQNLIAQGVQMDCLVDNCCREEVRQIVIGTFTDMADTEFSFEKRDIVIVVDAKEAIGQRPQNSLSGPDLRFCLVGFVVDGEPTSPYEHDVLTAIFGPALHRVPKPGERDVGVSVAWVRVDSPVVLRGGTPIKVANRGYYQHSVRNRLCAGLAEAVGYQDYQECERRVPGLGAWLRHNHAQNVCIAVNTVKHALRLAEMLPTFRIVTSPDAFLEGISPSEREFLASRYGGWDCGERSIVTMDAFRSVELPRYDVFIWAGGGIAPPRLPKHFLTCPKDQRRELLIVDFDDRHHLLLRKWSRWRADEYEQCNWFAPGVGVTDGRITRFLKQRGLA